MGRVGDRSGGCSDDGSSGLDVEQCGCSSQWVVMVGKKWIRGKAQPAQWPTAPSRHQSNRHNLGGQFTGSLHLSTCPPPSMRCRAKRQDGKSSWGV